MKILLIHQPYRFDLHKDVVPIVIPRSLLVIGACLLKKGHEVRVLDMQINRLTPAAIPSVMSAFQPDIVGLSIHAAPFVPGVQACCSAVKSQSAETPIVVGGIFTSTYKQKIFDVIPAIDIVVLNEGEETIVEIMESMGGEQPLGTVAGIIYRNEQAEVVETQPRPRLADVTTSPLPAYDLIDMEAYRDSNALPPPIEAQRGCPYACKFCGVHYPNWGSGVRYKDAGAIVDEIEILHRKYGFGQFFFTDEIITLNPKYIGEICEKLIERDLHRHVAWTGYSRADRISPELAQLMAKAGCTCLALGVETGSQSQLDSINKNASLADYRKGIQVIKDAGIAVHALMIIGFPEVEHRDIQLVAKFLMENQPTITQFFIFHPVPGTSFFEEPEKNGLLYRINTLEDWYGFDFIEAPLCDTQNLTREDIIKYFLLYNLAFNSFESFGDNRELQLRLYRDAIPRKRKEAVIARTGSACLLAGVPVLEGSSYTDLYKNTQVITEIQYEMLLRCNGDFTVEEIAQYLSRIHFLPLEESLHLVVTSLRQFEKAGVISTFPFLHAPVAETSSDHLSN